MHMPQTSTPTQPITQQRIFPTTDYPRLWWIAAILTSISPPTAFLYVGRWWWAVGGYIALAAWIIFCTVAGFSARCLSVLIMLGLFLLYSAIPVLRALARKRPYSLRSYNRLIWYAASLIIWLAPAVWINLSPGSILGLRTMSVSDINMYSTLLPGDEILIDTRAYARKSPAIGDIVLYQASTAPQPELLARVVALPGDTVSMRLKTLYLNGKRMTPPHTASFADSVTFMPSDKSNRDSFTGIEVPPGHVFILGDSRDTAVDSRNVGPIDKEMIIGRAEFVFYSRDGLVTRLERIGLRLNEP